MLDDDDKLSFVNGFEFVGCSCGLGFDRTNTLRLSAAGFSDPAACVSTFLLNGFEGAAKLIGGNAALVLVSTFFDDDLP